MSETRRQFFDDVARQAHVPLLERTSGTVLIEIKDGDRTERRYVIIHRGDVSVSTKGSKADCTVRTDGETFDAIVKGKMSTLPALLRGRLEIEGKIQLVVALQALFQPSSGAVGEQAGYARRRQ